MWAADDTIKICIYGDNGGSNEVHREILRQAELINPRLFIICGDVTKFDNVKGSPESVLSDYRKVFASKENSMSLWPSAPGPAVFVVPGGNDEQYFLDSKTAAMADASTAKRYAYEGINELGTKLYEPFHLDEMRIRVQPLKEINKPFPKSPYGDYLLYVGVGARRDLGILFLYRTDRWGFREDQVNWAEQTLHEFRTIASNIPLIAVAHDWTWYYPDTLDDGSIDGVLNGVSQVTPQSDQIQKFRLLDILDQYRADVLIASDRHTYSANIYNGMLRVNCSAAICEDGVDKKAESDNVWLEYSQNSGKLSLTVHAIDTTIGCGLRPEAAAMGIKFEKNRTSNSAWQNIFLKDKNGN